MVALEAFSPKKKPGINFVAIALDAWQVALQRLVVLVVILAALVVVFWLSTSSFLAYKSKQKQDLQTAVNQVVASLKATSEFERAYIVVSDKLSLYQEIDESEKMIDLFPRLSALVPDGVRLQDMSIGQQTVIITAVSDDLNTLTLFYNNLQMADGTLMADGQRFKLKDLTYRDVSKDTSGLSAGSAGFIMSFTFNYLIEAAEPMAPETQSSNPTLNASDSSLPGSN